ncbi:hypothetical protein BJ170DRAFT_182149 [Xylariales sp. AK1849]|nr:hypothetical protein BJ170DRAFT_182149 [Xylariales sp. AK1849]
MQFKNLLFPLLVAVVAADELSDLVASIPSCALTCLMTSVSEVGCGVTDYSCQCGKASDVQSSVKPCITKSCSTTDAATAETVSLELCAQVLGSSATSALASATSAVASGASSVATAATGTGTVSSATSTSTSGAGRVEAGYLAGAAAMVALVL